MLPRPVLLLAMLAVVVEYVHSYTHSHLHLPTNTLHQQSSGFMPAFASLAEQKRGSQDSATRRASMSDQAPKSGLFGQFFHKYVTIVIS